MNRTVSRFSVNNDATRIFTMTNYQRKIAASAIHLMPQILPQRRRNHQILMTAIEGNKNFIVPYKHQDGLCFKYIIFL